MVVQRHQHIQLGIISCDWPCEHMAIAGGSLLIVWYTLHKYRNRGEDDWR